MLNLLLTLASFFPRRIPAPSGALFQVQLVRRGLPSWVVPEQEVQQLLEYLEVDVGFAQEFCAVEVLT